MESIQLLSAAAEAGAVDLYCGRGGGADVPGFCALLVASIAAAAQGGADRQDPAYRDYLRKYLPKSIEILCKRKTKMYVKISLE
jgi:hypothetical protein